MVGRSQAGSDQILGRCWAELVQELGADAGQGKILGRCLADAGADAGQFLGRCWVDAGQLLGRSWPDAGQILRSILNLSALPVPMLSQVFFLSGLGCFFVLFISVFFRSVLGGQRGAQRGPKWSQDEKEMLQGGPQDPFQRGF